MKRLKMVCATVLLTWIGAMLVGCQSENTVETKNEVETSQSEDAESQVLEEDETVSGDLELTKPDSIHWMVHSGMNEENGTDQWAEEFERLTGIGMNLDIVSNNEYSTILELAFASDTVPDVFDLTGDNLAVYASQGAIADLTELVQNSEFYDKVDSSLWEAVELDGKIYGVPMEIPSGGVTYVRKDWLDRLNLEVPTTYEEFIDMLRAFQEEIPECIVPMTAPGLESPMNLEEYFQGATQEFTKVDGEWVDGMAQDNMEDALQRLQDAYAEGLLDSELVTNTTSNCRDQWYSGSVGVFNYWAGLWGQTLTERLQVNVPEAEVVAIPPIEGAVYQYRTPSVLCISSDLSEEEIASIFHYFIEYMHDGGEGQVLFQSGVEDLHWKQEGNQLVPLPTLSNPDETLQKAWITPWLTISPLDVTDKEMDLDPSVTDSLAVIEEYGVQKPVSSLSDTLAKIKADLDVLRQDVLAKVIMGNMTVEEGMSKYREEAEALGVSKVLEEMNQ